ncbi:MAG: tetratricopeptide repeat protein [Flavobacteriales bacterium]|nr:hypothetical protein [Flavobacteriales bacterium]MCC6577547.1 tetratricopeptide repeat protein [Flavobacteriales bacterium]NUQ16310.1 tetratricopeptide repeat protein [Flavobacteriales bacterium]
MRALLLLPALWAACCVTAQDASLVPGLRADLRAARDDTARADALARICFNLIRSDPDSARLVGEQALVLARRIQHPKALGDAHNNLGWLAAEQGRLDRADSLLHIALGIFQRMGVPAYVNVTLSNLGWVADKRGDSVGALKLFHQALEQSEAARDTASTAKLLYSIGVACRKVGEHARSREYLERSLALERALGRRNAEANCLTALANTLRDTGDTLAAVERFGQAAVIFRSIHDQLGMGIVEENLGDLASARDAALALHHYAAALERYEAVDSPTDMAYVLRRIGDIELREGRIAAARTHLRRGDSLAAGIGDRQLVLEFLLARARLASMQGDALGTFALCERHAALKDSLQGADTQRELARLRTEFESARKEKDNAILRAENSEQAARLRSGEVRMKAIIAVAVLVLLAALLLLRNFLQKRRHARALEELNAQLAGSNAEIREINDLLAMKLLRSQMNPHFIYNCLNSAARMTQVGQQVEALAYLQGFARLLRMVLDHSVNDRVGIAEELDFLRQYLKLEAARMPDLHYTVEADRTLLDGDADVPALLVQPFVENAIWHGLAHKEGGRSIAVRFVPDGEAIRCTITDNGVGRAQAARDHAGREQGHRSLGMQLTGERLKLLFRRLGDAGAIQVEDLRDADGLAAGTRVTVRLG